MLELDIYYKRNSSRNSGGFFCDFFKICKNIYCEEYLQVAVSETPVSESVFNKFTSLTTWRPVTLLNRDSSTGVYLWVLRTSRDSLFAGQLLATTSAMILFGLLFSD